MLDFDLNTEIKIKTECHKKCKIEKFDESSSEPKKSNLVVNPFAINNRRIKPLATNNKSSNPKSFKNKRRNSGPPEIKLDVKRFKKEHNITCKVEKNPSSVSQPKKQEQSKCTIANVSSKTFQIKKCSVQIEKCEGLETAK